MVGRSLPRADLSVRSCWAYALPVAAARATQGGGGVITTVRGWLEENPMLALAVWFQVALAVLALVAMPFDKRQILGLNPWVKLLLTTPRGLFRKFDGVSTTWKDPQHIGLKMFYCWQVSGSPPRPFAGVAARVFGTRAEADRTYR